MAAIALEQTVPYFSAPAQNLRIKRRMQNCSEFMGHDICARTSIEIVQIPSSPSDNVHVIVTTERLDCPQGRNFSTTTTPEGVAKKYAFAFQATGEQKLMPWAQGLGKLRCALSI